MSVKRFQLKLQNKMDFVVKGRLLMALSVAATASKEHFFNKIQDYYKKRNEMVAFSSRR